MMLFLDQISPLQGFWSHFLFTIHLYQNYIVAGLEISSVCHSFPLEISQLPELSLSIILEVRAVLNWDVKTIKKTIKWTLKTLWAQSFRSIDSWGCCSGCGLSHCVIEKPWNMHSANQETNTCMLSQMTVSLKTDNCFSWIFRNRRAFWKPWIELNYITTCHS